MSSLDLNDAPLISPWAGSLDLNNVEKPFDYDEFWHRIAQYAPHWVPLIYPAGRLSADRREYRLANVQGHAPRKQGSFVISLTGPGAGSGFEYDEGKRYSATEMIEALYGLKGNEAIAVLCKAINMDCPWSDAPAPQAKKLVATLPPAPTEPPAAPPPVDPDRYAGDVRLIMSKFTPARGTMVEKYWASRGIPMPDTPDLGFVEDCTDHAEKIGKPAMIGIVRAPDGKVMAGVHRTFLNADGSKTKKMIGHCAGGAVRLREMGADGILGVSEGIESGAAAMWLYDVPVWATLSTTGMIRLDVTKIAGLRKLKIFADKGEGGEKAANELAGAAQMAGIEAEIIYPQSDDDFAKDVKQGRRPEPKPSASPQPIVGEILPSFDSLYAQANAMNKVTPMKERTELIRMVALAHLSPTEEGMIQRAFKTSCGMPAAEFRQELAHQRKLANAASDNRFIPPEARAVAERYVLIKKLNAFFDLQTGEFLKKQAIIDAHTREMPLDEYGQPEDVDKYLTKTPNLGTVCDGITFIPRSSRIVVQNGSVNLNTWVDPCIQPVPGDVQPWLDHINYLMDGDEVAFKHMCWYLAHVIAVPEVKISHAPLIVSSAEGVGKTTLGRMLRHIVGKKNCTLIENSDLTSDFNEWVDGKQLVVVNELKAEGDVNVRNRLAQYITDDTLRVNRKGMPTYDYENRMNFLFFSNYKDATVLRNNDRRFFVWISGAQPKPESYYEHFNHWFFNLGGAEAVLDWAQKYDLSQHRPHARPPMTRAKEEVIEASRSNLEQRLQEMFDANEHPFMCDLVRVSDVAEYLEKERRLGKVPNKKIVEFIESVGGMKLGRQVRINGDGLVRLWVIRNHAKWYEADDRAVADYWFKPGEPSRGSYGGVLN